MDKAKNVVEFYVWCNKLKNVIRTGWLDWNVNKDRLESVAEHIYGVQMLALGIYMEYKYPIDIYKVLMMLAVHEMEEIILGDLTLFEINSDEKRIIGHQAIEKILSNLLDGDKIKNLILEFDARETSEAKFAFYCDKLECDIQSKIYDENMCVDLTKQDNNRAFSNPVVQELLKSEKSWSAMWLTFSQMKYGYDETFTEISKYVKENDITK